MLLSLNAVLLRRTRDPISALSDDSAHTETLMYWDGTRWDSFSRANSEFVSAAMPGDVLVILMANPRSSPPWQEFIRRELDLEFGSGAMSYGAIVSCAVPDPTSTTLGIRWVAWTFGPAAKSLQRAASDPRFGLTIALNALSNPPSDNPSSETQDQAGSSPRMRQVSYRTTAPYFQQTGHRAARDIPVGGFRIDRASDLLASIGGRTGSSTAFTDTIVGGRSARFRSEVAGFKDLTEISQTLLDLSLSKGYSEKFAWVDNIKLVEDDELIRHLRQRLLDDLLATPIPTTVDVLLPDDLLEPEDDRSISYILFPMERIKKANTRNLVIERVAWEVGRKYALSGQLAVLDAELRFLDDAHNKIGRAKIIECICAELLVDDELFIAYDGDFYKVDRSFVQRIDEELERLPQSSIEFPSYGGGTEPAYVDTIKKEHQDRFVVLDSKLIHVEGETGIEPCDLVPASGALVHLKRKGKASSLSHLFLQAANSCELLRRSPEAQEACRPDSSQQRERAAHKVNQGRPCRHAWEGRSGSNLRLPWQVAPPHCDEPATLLAHQPGAGVT